MRFISTWIRKRWTRRVATLNAAALICLIAPNNLRLRALLICFIAHTAIIDVVVSISLAPVYWNISNPIFKSSKNDHIIDVEPFDEIDFICPHYATTPDAMTSDYVPSASRHAHDVMTTNDEHGDTVRNDEDDDDDDDIKNHEYFLIYRVSKREYDECGIYWENSTTVLLLNCSQPRHRKRYTILFEPFQSIPNVLEYKPGNSYYFITPSTGRRHGLLNLYHGACHTHNMRLTVRVNGNSADYQEQHFGVPDLPSSTAAGLNHAGPGFIIQILGFVVTKIVGFVALQN